MNQYQIAVVVGSLRKDSFNRKLANAIVKLAPSEFSFKQVEIGDLPLYNQDDDANQAAPSTGGSAGPGGRRPNWLSSSSVNGFLPPR